MGNGNLAHKAQNDTRFDDLVKEVREFGRESASGKDALPKLAMRVVRAANDGVIDLEKDKDTDKDAAQTIYEEYVKAESKKVIHDHSAGGQKANVSKLRQLITFGVMITCDPVDVLNRAADVRKELADTEIKVKPAYAAYVSVARTQIARDTDLTDEELRDIVRKPAAPDKTVEKILQRVEKQLEKLVTGEAGVQDQSEEVIAALDNIRNRLASLLSSRELAELREKAEEHGLELKQPTEAWAEQPEEAEAEAEAEAA